MIIRSLALVFTAVCCIGPASVMAQNSPPGWVTSWSTSQQGLAQQPVANATLRLITRVTLPGDAVRVRLDNSFGTQPVTFSHATIAPRFGQFYFKNRL